METRDSDLEEIAKLLYGDGAWEYISKLQDRTKRRLTAGLSAVGASAGAAGLGYAAHKTGGAYKVARTAGLGRKAALGQAVKHEKFGTALIPLEVAGLGGEVLATKILHGDTKKQVHKRFRPIKSVKTTINNAEQASTHAASAAASASRSAQKIERMIPSRKAVIGAGLGLAGVTGAANYGATYYGSKHGQRAARKEALQIGKRQVVSKRYDIVWSGEISKIDEDKRQVFGWASVVTMNGQPVVDLQDDYMAMETIEKAVYDYVKTSRKGGNMHARDGQDPMHVSDMIESFVVTEEKKEKLGLPPEFPTGWLVGFQVNDDETWAMVKDGRRRQFSIHGSGHRVEKVLD